MSKMDRLELRVDHAWKCLEAFKKEQGAFLRSHPYRLWQESKPEGQYQYACVYIEQTVEPPAELVFLTGDCIHNLRATLDNLVSDMPNADPKLSAFIIKGKPELFRKAAARRLTGIPKRAIDILESLQPYRLTKSSYGSTIPIGTQLLKLERLWNQDKHRAPSIVVSFLRGTGLHEPGQGWHVTLPPDWLEVGPPGILRERRELWRAYWGGEGPEPEVQLQADVELDVVFDRKKPTAGGVLLGPELPAGGESVQVVLADLYQCVREDILPLFEPFL